MPERRLNIVADAHIWGVKPAFSNLPGCKIQLRLLEAGEITSASVKRADILLTRSSTKVDAKLLEGSAVRFAATATIGDDHYDKEYLTSHGIAFANAAGSSTGSVLEYMIAVLLELHCRNIINIPKTRLGIIGAGRIGGSLGRICHHLDMPVLLNDPPRARSEGKAGFSELGDLLADTDMLTLHTPLIRHGEDCTLHMLGHRQLSRFRGRGIINAARGGCIDNRALVAWLESNPTRFAVLDCWEHEPLVLRGLLSHPQVIIATPHIAGHSVEGKATNTQFVYNALCNWLDLKPAWNMDNHLPPADAVAETRCGDNEWHDLHNAVHTLYPVARDDAVMRSWQALSDQDFITAFTSFRRHYPERRSWNNAPVRLLNPSAESIRLAKAMKMNIMSA